MAFDTKPNLSNDKFEQFIGENIMYECKMPYEQNFCFQHLEKIMYGVFFFTSILRLGSLNFQTCLVINASKAKLRYYLYSFYS